jgi:hypothetical protein
MLEPPGGGTSRYGSRPRGAGKVDGGALLNLLDRVAFSCASRYSGRYAVTLSVDQVVFKERPASNSSSKNSASGRTPPLELPAAVS